MFLRRFPPDGNGGRRLKEIESGMIDLKRVLFATDFSDLAETAQDYACEFAARFGAELHVLHVLQDVMLMMPEPGSAFSLPQNYMLDLKQAAEKTLESIPSAAWCQGKKVVRATRMGAAFVEIVRYAREHDIDLIVIGTHGRGGLKHVLLGSVAERVVRKAACPVLTVRHKGHQFVMP